MLITIDGPTGSGKTTLAAQIEYFTKQAGDTCEVIHLDDLYGGWKNALGENLTKSLDDILQAFNGKEEIQLPQFDWHSSSFISPKLIRRPEVLILEGVGSGQPITRPHAEIKIWINVPAQVGLARVIARDGESIKPFIEEWQREELAHFAQSGSQGAADYHVSGAP